MTTFGALSLSDNLALYPARHSHPNMTVKSGRWFVTTIGWLLRITSPSLSHFLCSQVYLHIIGASLSQPHTSMCVALVASLTEEMAARSIAYHAHAWTVDGDKFSCYPLLVCHDMLKSAMHCSLRLAPTMINHLTSYYVVSLASWDMF